MRFNLIDLLIFAGFMAVGTLFASSIFGPKAALLSLLSGVVAYLAVSPWLYRRFRMRPMWLPKCPACRYNGRQFWFTAPGPDWPLDRIVCSKCRTTIELWYEPPVPEAVSQNASSFLLLWPQSWGRWRQIGKF